MPSNSMIRYVNTRTLRVNERVLEYDGGSTNLTSVCAVDVGIILPDTSDCFWGYFIGFVGILIAFATLSPYDLLTTITSTLIAFLIIFFSIFIGTKVYNNARKRPHTEWLHFSLNSGQVLGFRSIGGNFLRNQVYPAIHKVINEKHGDITVNFENNTITESTVTLTNG